MNFLVRRALFYRPRVRICRRIAAFLCAVVYAVALSTPFLVGKATLFVYLLPAYLACRLIPKRASLAGAIFCPLPHKLTHDGMCEFLWKLNEERYAYWNEFLKPDFLTVRFEKVR